MVVLPQQLQRKVVNGLQGWRQENDDTQFYVRTLVRSRSRGMTAQA